MSTTSIKIAHISDLHFSEERAKELGQQDPSEEPDQTGIIGRRGMAVRQNPAWTLGHRRDEHHAPGPQEFLLRKPGTVLASEAVPTTTARFIEPPCTEPFARWCGRTAGETPPPTRLCKKRDHL